MESEKQFNLKRRVYMTKKIIEIHPDLNKTLKKICVKNKISEKIILTIAIEDIIEKLELYSIIEKK